MRPLTVMMSNDGHIFLPVTLSEGQKVHFLQGNDEAYKECLAHEQEVKSMQHLKLSRKERQKEIGRLLKAHGLECSGGIGPFDIGFQIYKGKRIVWRHSENVGMWDELEIATLEYLQHYTDD